MRSTDAAAQAEQPEQRAKRKPTIAATRYGDVFITQTKGDRESGASFAMVTRELGTGSKSTLVISVPDGKKTRAVRLTGREALTLRRVLEKHRLRGDKPASAPPPASLPDSELVSRVAKLVSAAYAEGAHRGQNDLIGVLARMTKRSPESVREQLERFVFGAGG